MQNIRQALMATERPRIHPAVTLVSVWLLLELWNTNEPGRQAYLQSHGQQLALDVSTPPLLNPQETVLSICLT